MWLGAFGTLYRLGCVMAPAFAADAAAEEPAESLPVLLSHLPAAYPEEALERALEGDVVLSVAVDEAGAVYEVALVEGAGHGFDAPAVEAAWSMVFAPALNARGRPVPATITYRYPFRMSAVPPLSIEGEVRVRNEKKVVADALIRAIGPHEEVARTRSDETGQFRFAALPAGEWTLTVSGQDLRPSSAAVEVPEGGYVDRVVLTAELVPQWMEYDEGVSEYVEVNAERAPDPAEREISRDVIVTLPGSMGDPMRALQNLPGVARAPFSSGQIAIRGMDTEDTSYLINGVRVPIVFHFTAVSTVVSADLLSGIGFYPGGWSVRYGRAIGGVIDLETNDDLPQRNTTAISGDIFQVAGFSRIRLGHRTALSLSARRSYIDTVAQPILSQLGAPNVKVPRYWDAQLHLVQSLPRDGRLTATLLLSDDTFRILGESGDDAVTFDTNFQKGILRHLQPTGRGWSVETTFALGPEKQELVLSGERTDLDALGIPVNLFGELPAAGNVTEEAVPRWSLRHEWSRPPGDGWWGVRAGLDASWGQQRLDYTIGQSVPESGALPIATPALYLEPMLHLGPIVGTVGARLEPVDLGKDDLGNNPAMDVTLDERASLVATFDGTKLLAHAGTYSQPPASRELLGANGPSLTLERSTQVSVGIDQRLFGDAHLGVTLYHSWLRDLIVGRDDVFRFDRTTLVPGSRYIPFVNAGAGRTFGAEIFGRWETDARIVWLAVSLSRAFRRDLPEDEEHPALSDQPVNATLIVSQALGRWRVGGRLRYVTGPPTTPVLATVYSTDLQTWVPLYGEAYSERAPSFFSLDLRVDREWWYPKWKLAVYAEVQNATNHTNVEIPGWSEDFSEPRPVTGLPVLPVIGARAQW